MKRIRHVARRLGELLRTAAALVWRSLLFRTTIIAITGSVGKTTTKDCLAAILSAYYPTTKTDGNRGARWSLPATLLRTRPWHRFVVAEVGIDLPGQMWRSTLLLRPHIVIVLHVKRNHSDAFSTLEVTATEKAKLLGRLGRRGVAILNGDDPRVMAMASGAPFEVRTFGTSSEHDVWSSEPSAQWPNRLEFTAHTATESQLVRTRLVGTHWTTSVVAALTAATRCGLTLEQAVKPLIDVEPYRARLQPVELPSGAVLLRDEFNGSIDSLGPALKVLEEARAPRRWLVISDVADTGLSSRHRMRQLASLVPGNAECCVFVGETAAYAKRRAMEAGITPENAHSFLLPHQAADFLRTALGPGDLVLLRGRGRDHLTRIAFAQLGTVQCRKTRCQRRGVCDNCPELGFKPEATAADA